MNNYLCELFTRCYLLHDLINRMLRLVIGGLEFDFFDLREEKLCATLHSQKTFESIYIVLGMKSLVLCVVVDKINLLNLV